MSVAVIVLAAGCSSRLGQPKQLLRIGETTLIELAARKAQEAAANPVVVVLGADRHLIEHSVRFDQEVSVVFNAEWQRGMGSSISSGITAVRHIQPGAAAVTIMLCDQPLIPVSHLIELRERLLSSDALIAASKFAETFGPPAIFSRELFDELEQLRDDRGARSLIKKYIDRTHFIDMEDAAIDIDTMEDYRSATLQAPMHR